MITWSLTLAATAWLGGEGYRVMRVSTTDVYTNLAGVLDTISAALRDLPPARAVRHPRRNAIGISRRRRAALLSRTAG